MSEERDCVVKLVDDHGVEHSVRVRAESVYEAALRGLRKLELVGWESDGSQIGWVTVGVWEEPTREILPRLTAYRISRYQASSNKE